MAKDKKVGKQSQVSQKEIDRMLRGEEKKKYFPGFSYRDYTACFEEIWKYSKYFTGVDIKILLHINRQTRGYDRDFNYFFLDEFVHGIRYSKEKAEKTGEAYYWEGTGSPQPVISRRLKALLDRRVIEKKTYCKHCKTELPQIKKRYKRNGKEYWRWGVYSSCPNCHQGTEKNTIIHYGLKYKANAGELYDRQTLSLSRQQTLSLSTTVNLSTDNPSSSLDHVPNVQEGFSQVSNDDDYKKPSEEKTPQSQAKDQGRSSHNQNARDAHTLTGEAERVVEIFRRAFGRQPLDKIGDLNTMVEEIGIDALIEEIPRIAEYEGEKMKPKGERINCLSYIAASVRNRQIQERSEEEEECPKCSGRGTVYIPGRDDGKVMPCPRCGGCGKAGGSEDNMHPKARGLWERWGGMEMFRRWRSSWENKDYK